MSVADVFADFEGVDFIKPRAFYANHTFNMEGICLYYYIHGSDSKGYDAVLKIDFFNNRVRFTNFSKPHPTEKYKPYFNKFRNSLSCSYDDWEQELVSLLATSTEYLNSMAKH